MVGEDGGGSVLVRKTKGVVLGGARDKGDCGFHCVWREGIKDCGFFLGLSTKGVEAAVRMFVIVRDCGRREVNGVVIVEGKFGGRKRGVLGGNWCL